MNQVQRCFAPRVQRPSPMPGSRHKSDGQSDENVNNDRHPDVKTGLVASARSRPMYIDECSCRSLSQQ